MHTHDRKPLGSPTARERRRLGYRNVRSSMRQQRHGVRRVLHGVEAHRIDTDDPRMRAMALPGWPVFSMEGVKV